MAARRCRGVGIEHRDAIAHRAGREPEHPPELPAAQDADGRGRRDRRRREAEPAVHAQDPRGLRVRVAKPLDRPAAGDPELEVLVLAPELAGRSGARRGRPGRGGSRRRPAGRGGGSGSACRRARTSQPASGGSAATDPAPAAGRTRARRASRRRRGCPRGWSRSRGRRCPCPAGPGRTCCRCARPRDPGAARRPAPRRERRRPPFEDPTREPPPTAARTARSAFEPAPPPECRRACSARAVTDWPVLRRPVCCRACFASSLDAASIEVDVG